MQKALMKNEGENLSLLLTIIEIEDRKYLLPDGSFQVYEWQDSSWINLYHKINTGYNYESQKFDYKGNLYSFGGYGYWRMHGDLIRFLWDKNEWEIVPYDDYPLGGNGPVFVRDSFLYVIEPIRYNDGLWQNRKILPSYAINLNTGHTKPFDHPDLFSVKRNKLIVDIGTENYLVILHQPAYLLDKNDLQFYTSKLSPFISLQSLIYITGDRIRFYSGDISLVADHDLAKMIRDFKKMKENFWSFKNLFIMTSLSVTFLAILMAYLRFKRRRQHALKDLVFDQTLVNTLLEWQGQSITSDKLDELLNLHDIRSAETLRFKRAQLINGINTEYQFKTGQKLISRIQDPGDKRRFMYRIG